MTPRINDTRSRRLPTDVSVMRGVDGATYIRGIVQKVFRRGRVGPLKAVVKLFKIRKIGAKLIFFSQISTPRINDTRRRRLPCLLWKGRSKRKHKRFDIEAYYRNKTKTFDLVRLLTEQKQNVSICSKII